MSTLVIVLRVLSLLAFAGPVLVRGRGRRGEPEPRARRESAGLVPVVANLAAFGLFLASLLVFSGSTQAAVSLPLAAAGSVVALVGAAVVVGSRAELGAAWSLVPRADRGAGLVTTGPYRLVRHPIYLGLALLALGAALAFASGPALAIVPGAIVPTLAWRARAEERLLCRTFGERYEDYRRRTPMIVPFRR